MEVGPNLQYLIIEYANYDSALVAACTCLGRAPGYKPADVNQALMDSLEVMPTS